MLDKTIDGKTDSTETTEGSYVVSENHVIIRDSGEDPSDDDRKLFIKGDSLIAEIGWTAQILLKGLGAPKLVFVKEQSS